MCFCRVQQHWEVLLVCLLMIVLITGGLDMGLSAPNDFTALSACDFYTVSAHVQAGCTSDVAKSTHIQSPSGWVC